MSTGYQQTVVTEIEIPSVPDIVPMAIDDFSLAFSLGFRNKVLWYVLNDVPNQYERCKIPKKSGGHRVIHQPTGIMKTMLRQFLKRYLNPLQEQLGDHVTAYRDGKSVRDAAVFHIPECDTCDSAPRGVSRKKHDCPRKGTYIHMDLKDFFPNTSAKFIRDYFKSIGYSHVVSGMMANLLTVRDIPNPRHSKGDKDGTPAYLAGVPQGSPASGAICNLVADQRIDGPLRTYFKKLNASMGLRGEYKWRYSRYSDDLSFTCGKVLSKEETAKIVADIQKIVREGGYRINRKKTRVVTGYYRKTILGIVFNDKPNYSKDAYMRLRAITYNCMVHGFDSQVEKAKQENAEGMICWLRGKINWVNQVNPEKGAKLLDVFQMALAKHVGVEDEQSV